MQFSNINNESKQSSLVFWRQSAVQRILITLTTTILFVSSTLAKSLDEYCVSRIGKKPEPTKFDSYSDKKPKQVTIRTATGLFDISIDNYLYLVLRRKGSSIKLSEVKVRQNEFSVIKSLILTKNRWVWVDGLEIDYMVELNTSSTLPTFGAPIAFPKIFSKPCSMFSDFFGSCLRAQGIYSKTLGRAFVEGHRVNFFGFSEPVSFEMMQGTVKPLPKPLQGARFVADVPQLKGALFRGVSDEALFYDGLKVTTLIKGSSAQWWLDNSRPNWYVINIDSVRRTFLTNIVYLGTNNFFMELKPELILVPIAVPGELNESWLSFYSHIQDSRLWVVTRDRVVTEVKDSLHTVLKVEKPSFIDGPKGIGQAPDGTLAFTVKNPKTKSSTQYFIIKASPTTHCKVNLNADKPIFLSN
jgi:hypothetical protein